MSNRPKIAVGAIAVAAVGVMAAGLNTAPMLAVATTPATTASAVSPAPNQLSTTNQRPPVTIQITNLKNDAGNTEFNCQLTGWLNRWAGVGEAEGTCTQVRSTNQFQLNLVMSQGNFINPTAFFAKTDFYTKPSNPAYSFSHRNLQTGQDVANGSRYYGFFTNSLNNPTGNIVINFT